METLLIALVIIVIYLVWLCAKLRSDVAQLSALYVAQTAEQSKPGPKVKDTLGYEWYDDGWPYQRTEWKDNELDPKFENPLPFQYRDEYSNALLLAEYAGAKSPVEKKAMLRRIRRSGATVPWQICEKAFNDESSVKIWAAAHLPLIHNDFTNCEKIEDYSKAPVLRDFDALTLKDPDPVVRAALYSNPDLDRLPWEYFRLRENWQDNVASMSQLDRLALMRNPDLRGNFMVALMSETSARLQMDTKQHAYMISAGALNPDIIGHSRISGRDHWLGFDGDPFPPDEECGQIWKLAHQRWSDTLVPYFVFQYVQTTPKIKLEVYSALLTNDPKENRRLRQVIVESCEPLKDRDLLQLGLKDPDEQCRDIAKQRSEIYKQ